MTGVCAAVRKWHIETPYSQTTTKAKEAAPLHVLPAHHQDTVQTSSSAKVGRVSQITNYKRGDSISVVETLDSTLAEGSGRAAQ